MKDGHKYQPDPITQERANAIWEARGIAWALDLSLSEYRYVDLVWESMPGNTAWMDAFFRVLKGEVRYHRARHAAHYADIPCDVETWRFLGGKWTPRPGWVPPDAEYHSGHLDGAGRQFAVWVRSIPAPIGSTCVHCERRPK